MQTFSVGKSIHKGSDFQNLKLTAREERLALAVNNRERALSKHVRSFTGELNKQALRAQDKPFKGAAKRCRRFENIYLGTEIKPKIGFKETGCAEKRGPAPRVPEERTLFLIWGNFSCKNSWVPVTAC